MDETGKLLSRVRDRIHPDTDLYAGFLARRKRRQRLQRISALVVGLGVLALLSGGILWAINESPRSVSLGEEPASLTPAPAPVRDTCVFPPYKVTYLPWLTSGEAIPQPELDRIAADGAPSYALVGWTYGDVRSEGGPELKGRVVLWRTTEPLDIESPDPVVPGLPGGSDEGFLATSPGEDSWAIVWLDEARGEQVDPCGYTTLVVSLPNLASDRVRLEALRIANSLVRAD